MMRLRGITRRQLARAVLLIVVPLAAAVVGAYVYVSGGRYVSTGNAYVKRDKGPVSAEVSGHVVAVAVREHQRVAPGDPLFRLDPRPFRLALAEAQARVAAVRQEIEALRQTYRTRQAELARAREAIAFLRRERDRRQKLFDKGVMSEVQLDEARHNLRSAELEAEALREGLQRVLIELGGDPARPVTEHPRYLQADAAREQAALDLARTEVRAPRAGIVGPLSLQPGEHVRAGAPVFSIVGAAPWIEANLKETDLTHVTVGQPATVTVDAYPGRRWTAEVTSISPATGAEFSLLPPQNASGNWVKVVQRVPVRLALREGAGDGPPLRGGMSVEVTIDTGHRRGVPRFLRPLADGLPAAVERVLARVLEGPAGPAEARP